MKEVNLSSPQPNLPAFGKNFQVIQLVDSLMEGAVGDGVGNEEVVKPEECHQELLTLLTSVIFDAVYHLYGRWKVTKMSPLNCF